jgi:hypothetical protein
LAVCLALGCLILDFVRSDACARRVRIGVADQAKTILTTGARRIDFLRIRADGGALSAAPTSCSMKLRYAVQSVSSRWVSLIAP